MPIITRWWLIWSWSFCDVFNCIEFSNNWISLLNPSMNWRSLFLSDHDWCFIEWCWWWCHWHFEIRVPNPIHHFVWCTSKAKCCSNCITICTFAQNRASEWESDCRWTFHLNEKKKSIPFHCYCYCTFAANLLQFDHCNFQIKRSIRNFLKTLFLAALLLWM